LGAITQAMAGTRLAIERVESIGPHYATTLAQWRERFDANVDAVKQLGFDDRFIRMWRYYLLYCEAAFETRTMSVLQIQARKHY